jgi:hypothetical protein
MGGQGDIAIASTREERFLPCLQHVSECTSSSEGRKHYSGKMVKKINSITSFGLSSKFEVLTADLPISQPRCCTM